MQPTNKLQMLADGKFELNPVKCAMHMQPPALLHLVDIMMAAKTAICVSHGIHRNLLITAHHMGYAYCE